jgi:tRNA(fMet)-specific endonuclease VapC
MKCLIETNICTFIIRKKSNLALQRLRQNAVGDVFLSTVSLAELRYGAEKSQDPPANHAARDAFLAPLQVADFDSRAADKYGGVRADLE